MELEAVIGLEIHAQMSTKTKMFCRCDNDSFDKEPNINTCPVCMAFPGQLPVLNREAVEKGLRAALALNCSIPEKSKFDRKNYFYPDNSKGFQISQFDEPFSEKGYVDISNKRIDITRLHLEDDAGKLTHVSTGTLLDFNRAGTPLMEIVSEPDMRTAKEAQEYAREVQKIVRYVGGSEADMEKGMMRFDASVSIRPKGEDRLYPRAEIKNLNSFRALESAVEYEINRQKKMWEKGEKMTSAITMGWNDEKQVTYFLREKEESDDYRYFPEPDIPPLFMDKAYVDKIRDSLPELPSKKHARYLEDLGLIEDDARILSSDFGLSNYFETVLEKTGDVKLSVSFINTILMKYLKEDLISVDDPEQKVNADMMAELINLVIAGDISNNVAKSDVFEEMYRTGKFAAKIVEEKGLKQVSDTGLIESVCSKILDENPESVEDIKNGKDRAIGFLVGLVMKETKGQANPKMVNDMIRKIIGV